MKSLLNEKGSAVVDVVVAAAMVVFVLLPVFSFVTEKHIIAEKIKMIEDAVDMTNIAAYNALTTSELGKARVSIGHHEAMDTFERLLCSNLNLSEGLIPNESAIAEGVVEIVSFEAYTDGFPVKCSCGSIITRPTVHSLIKVPVKPSMYRAMILSLLGKEYIDIVVHVDSEIPVNK